MEEQNFLADTYAAFDEVSLNLLEYPKILEEIAFYTKSPASRGLVFSMKPLYYKYEIEKRFLILRDISRLISDEGDLSLHEFGDLSSSFQKLRPEGSFLEPLELFQFVRVFENIEVLKTPVNQRKDLPHLRDLINQLDDFGSLLNILVSSIDNEGNILSSASPELREIRLKKKNIENRIRKRIEEIIRDREISHFLQDQYITIRSGRWVIPLKADFKGQLPGIIHDISRTGETIYIEPLEITGLANEHENIIAEEKTEEIKVLKRISSMLRLRLSEIIRSYELLVYVDLLRSIALFSLRFKLEIPELTESNVLRLVKARHPLLLFLKEKGLIQEVIPLDMEIGGSSRMMIITGPNAGGKTIALKTVGLLTVMALSGIPVPASPGTLIPVVKDILLDIGDEQSIEQNLSSFSGHVKRISEILKMAGPGTLVLLDELGRATDPDEGSALGISILEEFFKRGSIGIATTHLINIALYFAGKEGFVNASMDFDLVHLKPLYTLKIGEPGFSHGLNIAKRFGLPEHLIGSARSILSSEKIEFENLIMELRQKRDFYERELSKLMELKNSLIEKERFVQEEQMRIEQKRNEILKKSLDDAKALLNETKRFINQLLIEAKRSPKQALKDLRGRESEIDTLLKSLIKEEESFEPVIGSPVYVRSLGYDGIVMRIQKEDKRVRIRAGAFEIEVPFSDIGPPRGVSVQSQDKIEPLSEEPVSDSLNLVGLRVEEAISLLEPFLNHASLSSKSEIKIIHGIGTGRLMKAVREYLKDHPLVDSIRAGSPEEGGEGVTFVKIK